MKKVLIIAFGILLVSSCTMTSQEDGEQIKRDLYHCDVPKEITDIAPGQDIYWDCTWEASYNNGRVRLITGDDGNLVAIVRTTPDLSCDSLHVTTP